MVLAHALVQLENENHTHPLPPPLKPTATNPHPLSPSHPIPQIPLHVARQIMTRADFIKSYDHINLFTITSTAYVRADSVPMQRAFRSICQEEGFEELLEKTIKRIGDIESLGRTRELVAKDLVLGGKYRISFGEGKGRQEVQVVLEEGEEAKAASG